MDRRIIEANVIFTMYRDIDLFKEYSKKIDVFKSFELEESQFFYSIGNELYRQGFKVIDAVAIESYMTNKPASREMYLQYGGYNTIKEITNIVEVNNFEKYYDDLMKLNIAKELQSRGFDLKNVPLSSMSSSDLYNYYDYLLNDLFASNGKTAKIIDFELTDKYIEDLHNGVNLGVSIAKTCPRLNFCLAGIRKKEVGVIAGVSGAGKSSFMFYSFILPLIKQKIGCGLISNEMQINKFMDMAISSVLWEEFKYYKLTRKRLKAGNFNAEEMEMLKKAKEYVNTHYMPYLKFTRTESLKSEETITIIKKLSREGIEYFFYDVFKADDMSDKQYIGLMVQFSKEIAEYANKLDVGIVMTQQIASYMENTRYLSRSCLSGSKQIIETIDFLIMLREIWDDEFADEKYDIEPYNLKKNDNGDYEKDNEKHAIKEMVNLDKDQKYLLAFLDKNRNGEDKKIFVYNFIGNYNIWKEVAYCKSYHINR